MIYRILVSFDANKVLPSVGNVVDEVNSHMEGFGFSEKLILRTERLPVASLTSSVPLNKEQLATIIAAYTTEWLKKFPDSRPEIEIIL